MKITPQRHVVKGLILAALIIAADQGSKLAMLEAFQQIPPPIEVAPFFNLTLVMNRGMSFGLLSGLDAVFVMIGITLIILSAVVVWLWRTPDSWLAWPLGLIIGGATGNIIDRFRYGAVVDFLDVHIGVYHWPAFNVADSAIVVGVLLIVWRSLILHDTRTM